jgi:hypothetical protein
MFHIKQRIPNLKELQIKRKKGSRAMPYKNENTWKIKLEIYLHYF